MNLRYLILLSLLFWGINSFGQKKIDNNLTVHFPGETKVKVLTENHQTLKVILNAFSFNTEQESFVVFRTSLEENGKEQNNPASTNKELNEIYNNEIKTQIDGMTKKGFTFLDSSRLNIKDHLAYRLKYIHTNTEEPGAESIILFLNGIRYVVTYSKISAFDEDNKNNFLNSITITDDGSLAQIAPTTGSGINFFKYGLYAILLAGFIYFRKASKNNSKMGTNLNAVYCPTCNTKQPIMQSYCSTFYRT